MLSEIVRQTSECLHERCRLWVKSGIPVRHFLWEHSDPFPVVNNSKHTSVLVAKKHSSRTWYDLEVRIDWWWTEGNGNHGLRRPTHNSTVLTRWSWYKNTEIFLRLSRYLFKNNSSQSPNLHVHLTHFHFI